MPAPLAGAGRLPRGPAGAAVLPARRPRSRRRRRPARSCSALGFRPELVTAVDNGVDPFFSPGGDRWPAPTVVAVARLAPVKRFELLLDVGARRPPARCPTCACGSSARARCAPTSSAGSPTTTPASWVDLLGHVSRGQLRDEYRRAWLVASASLAEGWGLSLTEAAACGTPAVATDISGHRCSVVDGVTGVLVAARRPRPGDRRRPRRRRPAAPARRRRPRQGPHADAGTPRPLGVLRVFHARRRRSRRRRRPCAPDGRPSLACRPWPSRRPARSSSCRRTTSGRTSPGCWPRCARRAPGADVLVVDDNSPDGTGDAGRGGGRRARARSSCCAGPASRASAAPTARASPSPSTRATT